MQLNHDDCERFGVLYNGLLRFAEKKLQPKSTEKADKSEQQEYGNLVAVRDALFANRQLIETFVKKNPCNLDSKELQIVSNWKYARVGKFFILRSLTKYTIFMGCEDNNEPTEEIFAVLALNQPFKDIVKSPMPVLVKAVLLPLKGKITIDGIMSFYEVDFGPEVREMLNGCYQYAKKQFGLITSLVPDESTSIDGLAGKHQKKNTKKQQANS